MGNCEDCPDHEEEYLRVLVDPWKTEETPQPKKITKKIVGWGVGGPQDRQTTDSNN
jgi:hypothetical protein